MIHPEKLQEERKVLKELLLDNSALGAFIGYLYKKNKYRGIHHDDRMVFMDYTQNTEASGWINSMCSWIGTDEGSTFWRDLHLEFNKRLEVINIRGTRCNSIW